MTTPYNIIEKVACSQGFPKGATMRFVPSYMSENIHNSNPDAERYRTFVGELVQGEN